jgi:hypothetical protein
MTFEELIHDVRHKDAEFGYELSKTLDPYRLGHLLKEHAEDIGHLYDEANQMVQELEDSHD